MGEDKTHLKCQIKQEEGGPAFDVIGFNLGDKLDIIKEGKKFDKCYAKTMAKFHKKEICKFKKEAKKTKDTDLKNFANGGIATLEQHKEMAKKACAAVKK